MCTNCGCGSEEVALVNLQTGVTTSIAAAPARGAPQVHEHGGHGHAHEHVHTHPDGGHTHPHHHGPDRDMNHHHEQANERDHRHGSHDDEGHPHLHAHPHPHASHRIDAKHGQGTEVRNLEARVLARNDALADRNRAWFMGRDILALNLLSSPGSGKTTLLERTIAQLANEVPLFVIEGDQATANDAERIRRAGAPAVQVNTGAGCHLDADMVARGIAELRPPPGALVMIENVGNLVCPALFDLGEHAKVVLFSVTEGEDKPLKYPHMFSAAKVVMLNKTDLLPHLDFRLDDAIANVRHVNPDATIFQISARSGEGLDAWYDWIHAQRESARAFAFG